jgi:hypothetical protein
MDRVYSILEEAQNIIGRDEVEYRLQQIAPLPSGIIERRSSASMYGSLPHPTPDKTVSAHKASKTLKKRTWKKPKDKPKRPLSAYNLFFQQERKRIIELIPDDNSVLDDGLTEEQRRRKHRKTHGKIGFADLAKSIAEKWKTSGDDVKAPFEARAAEEKERYQKELEVWNTVQKEKEKQEEVAEQESKKQLEDSDDVENTPAPLAPAQLGNACLITSQSLLKERQEHLLRLMMNSQTLQNVSTQPLWNPRSNNIHGAVMASCSYNLMLEASRVPFPPQHDGLCMSSHQVSSPTSVVDLTMDGGIDFIHPDETFSRDMFFQDITSGEDLMSDEAVLEATNRHYEALSVDDELNAIMDDLDAEIILT